MNFVVICKSGDWFAELQFFLCLQCIFNTCFNSCWMFPLCGDLVLQFIVKSGELDDLGGVFFVFVFFFLFQLTI